MRKLLSLLTDGETRTIEQLAEELGTDPEDIRRKVEFLERMGAIQKSGLCPSSCGGSCSGCESAAACRGCIPKNASQNMGKIWEVKRV
ncbi:MAG: hypothetical protein IKR73_04290 [Oscillospiraceae bacterium]|nr:hypothetical protein [Oscillospiraceae bacterium]